MGHLTKLTYEWPETACAHSVEWVLAPYNFKHAPVLLLQHRSYGEQSRSRVLPRQKDPPVYEAHVHPRPLAGPFVLRLLRIERVWYYGKLMIHLADLDTCLRKPCHEIVALPLADAGEEIRFRDARQFLLGVARSVPVSLI